MVSKIKAVSFLFLLTLSVSIFAEKSKSNTLSQKDPYEFELYGFARNDFSYDTRRTLASVGELYNFIPYDHDFNSLGQDLNAIPSARLLAISTRIGFNIKSPDYNGMHFNAKIETDFSGSGINNIYLRIRHAFFKINWKHHQILTGQTWHPMTSELMPSIVSLNTGAPFNSFNRSPQLRYNAIAGPVTLSAAFIYQLQYTSPGPSESIVDSSVVIKTINSRNFQSHGGWPEAYIGATFNSDHWKFGIGGEFMSIKPRQTGINPISLEKVIVNEHVNSFASQLYAQYRSKHVKVMAKSIYGQNVGHMQMMSGYGAYAVKSDGNSLLYAPIAQSTTWLNAVYQTSHTNHNIRAGLFFGYMKNLGADQNLMTDKVYVRGFDDIDQMFRISPSVVYMFKDLYVGLEYEFTGVCYGEALPDFSVVNSHLVSNHRAYVSVRYNFSHKFYSRHKH